MTAPGVAVGDMSGDQQFKGQTTPNIASVSKEAGYGDEIGASSPKE
jgi:hypothetical protein